MRETGSDLQISRSKVARAEALAHEGKGAAMQCTEVCKAKKGGRCRAVGCLKPSRDWPPSDLVC